MLWVIIVALWFIVITSLLLFIKASQCKGRCDSATKCGVESCPHYQYHYIYDDCDQYTICTVEGTNYMRRCVEEGELKQSPISSIIK